MSYEFDPADDFVAVVDSTESVVHTNASTLATTAIAAALRRAVSEQEAAASNGKYTASDVRWHFAADTLAAPPVPGDTLTDGDSVVWTIVEVEHATLDSRFACVTRRVAIAAGLDQLLDIQLATWSKGDAGAATAVWNTVATDVAARIQPLEREVVVEHLRRTIRSTHVAYIATPFDWTANHRIVGFGSEIFDVVRCEKKERLDQLEEVFLVRKA